MFKLGMSLAGVLLVVGCGQHPIDESIAIQNDFVNDICDCPDIVEPSYASSAECVDDLGSSLTQAEIDCSKAVYDRNESVAAPTASCFIDLSKQARDCVTGAACNLAAIQNCLDGFDLDACPQFPPSVTEEFSACTPSPPGP